MAKVMSAGSVTRDKILDAATELWAADGMRGVSLNVIVDAAGQKNASALQYHFKNRDGLIDALFERHTAGIRERREQLLSALDSSDPRAVAAALVLPLSDLMAGTWRDRGFLCIAADMLGDTPRARYAQVMSLGSADVVNRLMRECLVDVPVELRAIRLRVGGMMIVHSMADEIRRQGIHAQPSDVEIFSRNLLDMYVAAVTADSAPAS